MSPEFISPDHASEELPEDIFMANRFAWHGMQMRLDPSRTRTVETRLEIRNPAVVTECLDEIGPTEVGFYPEGTFPYDEPTTSYQQTMNMYPAYSAVITAVVTAELEAPGSSGSVQEVADLIPGTIVTLGAHDMLGAIGRKDLDDAERRYLKESHYFFRRDLPALRQDVFDLGTEKTHIVAAKPTSDELRRLHNEMYCYDGCPCLPCAQLGHYGTFRTLPIDKWLRFKA